MLYSEIKSRFVLSILCLLRELNGEAPRPLDILNCKSEVLIYIALYYKISIL